MKKSFLVVAILICFAAMSFTFISSTVPPFKNLKVLPKDISEKELDSLMHFYSRSLGQRCNFCHVRNEAEKTMDFASDDNSHKDIAREMMRMTDKINKEYFDFRDDKKVALVDAVTCYTCHRGQGQPETKPKGGMEDGRGNMQSDSLRRLGNIWGSMHNDSMENIKRDTARVNH